MTETVSGAGARTRRKGLKIERVFSTDGVHPYDELTWERRDVVQQNWKTGAVVFEQRGVERACQGRPVDADALALLAHRVEETVRAAGTAEVASHEVGMAILGPLRELDEVAYLRFASVYRNFSSVADFESEIADLRRVAREGAAPSTARNGAGERTGDETREEQVAGGEEAGRTSTPATVD